MARRPRKLSINGIYHVVIRGLDRQLMFDSSNDYKKYLETIALYKEECHFELYAYCLMSNHVHLLIKTTDTALETIFRKINTYYAVWFNMKYQRTGHLQQERFYSEPVEDQKYFINVIRYIHNNPFKAGMESYPGATYKWNSIHEYSSEYFTLIDAATVLNIAEKADLLDVFANSDKTVYLDIDSVKKRLPDDVAKEIICNITGLENCLLFQEIELAKRNYYIKEFHKNGVSIRQINRLTGIPRGIIQRVID